MRRSEALEGVRVIKFKDILGRYEAAEFTQLEAAELLGIGERTFGRGRVRFAAEGEAGSGGPRERSGSPLPDALFGIHRQALSRATGAAPRLFVELHLDEDVSSIKRVAGKGQEAGRASAQTAAPSVARHDAASG